MQKKRVLVKNKDIKNVNFRFFTLTWALIFLHFVVRDLFEARIGGTVARCSCYCVHLAVAIFCRDAGSRGAQLVCLEKEGGKSRGTTKVLTSWLWAPPSDCDWQIASEQLLISSPLPDLGSASQHWRRKGRRRWMAGWGTHKHTQVMHIYGQVELH